MIAGVDEAGRGALAGPVVAAAVILPENYTHDFLGDSKVIQPIHREEVVADLIAHNAIISVGIVSHREIDRINILKASLLAMKKAIKRLSVTPSLVRIDGNKSPDLGGMPTETIIKGDAIDPSISAASLVAKVVRDMLMKRYNTRYKGYGLDKHKGYATAMHINAIFKYGRSPIHRQSFTISKQERLFAK